jgi:hypothetical protein
MVTSVVATTEWVQGEKTTGDTDGAGLEALIHVDVKQTGGLEKPEDRQQLLP